MTTLTGLFTIGRDAELRATAAGDQVASVALAYNYGRKGQDGKLPTQWLQASLWGDRATKLAEHLTKGKQIYAEVGDVHIETYKKGDGAEGVKLAGRIGQLEFTRQASTPAQPPAPPPPPKPKPAAAPSVDDEDIPF